MHVNIHLPRWFIRREEARFRRALMRYYDLVPDLLYLNHGVAVSVSNQCHRADRLGPDSFAINHHSRFARRRNLNVKDCYLSDYIYVDRRGFSGWSEIAGKSFDPDVIDAKEAERYFRTKIWAGYLEAGQSKYLQPAMAPDLPHNGILIPLQGDAVLELAYLPPFAMVEALIASDLRPLIIKPHPVEAHLFPGYLAGLARFHRPEDGVFVLDGNLARMIAASRIVVTCTSGAGFEAFLYGKPVVTCGRSDFHHVTLMARNPAELIAACQAAKAPHPSLIHRYAYWFFGREALDMRDDPDKIAAENYRRLLLSAR